MCTLTKYTCTQIIIFTECNERVDVLFAIDASTSIGDANFENVIDFVRDVIVGLRIGTSDTTTSSRVAVVTYSDEAKVLFQLNVKHTHIIFKPCYSIFRTLTFQTNSVYYPNI